MSATLTGVATLYDQIGPDKLRDVLTDFYQRVYSDIMIGFLFHGIDRAQLIQREWEFTARLLGADMPYTGRPIPEAHAKHPILGGHFERRYKLLAEVLAAKQVPHEVQTAWLEHTRKLRALVTKDPGTECKH